jgi:hypothetical protein
MKRRIFASGPSGPRVVEIFRHRIPVGWAAVLALFAGLAGLYLSQWVRPPAAPAQAITVQIIKAPSDRNPFDLTEAVDWKPSEWTGRVLAPGEI